MNSGNTKGLYPMSILSQAKDKSLEGATTT